MYIYIYSKYIHICEWNPLKSLFKTRRLGYGIYYYEGLGFQWAHVSCNPLEQFNQVGVRHLVVKDGAVTMLYEASWRLLIGVIKCQHIDMSNLNPNQNRIEIKSINWHGRFLLISIWQFFFWQPPHFAVFVLHRLFHNVPHGKNRSFHDWPRTVEPFQEKWASWDAVLF